jgi:hypothetical protein
LVLLGVEKVSVDPTSTTVTPFDFSYYPYSHSLLMAALYSFILGFVFWKINKSRKAGIVLGLVVISHWGLDFLTHRPDLPLYFETFKVGLGLWHSVMGTFIVEVALFITGIILYLKASLLITKKRKNLFWSMIGFLSLVYIGSIFGPTPARYPLK